MTGQSCTPARMTRPRAAATPRRSTPPGVRTPVSAADRARRYSHRAHPRTPRPPGGTRAWSGRCSSNVFPQHQQLGRSTCSCATAAMCLSSPRATPLTRGRVAGQAACWARASTSWSTVGEPDKPSGVAYTRQARAGPRPAARTGRFRPAGWSGSRESKPVRVLVRRHGQRAHPHLHSGPGPTPRGHARRRSASSGSRRSTAQCVGRTHWHGYANERGYRCEIRESGSSCVRPDDQLMRLSRVRTGDGLWGLGARHRCRDPGGVHVSQIDAIDAIDCERQPGTTARNRGLRALPCRRRGMPRHRPPRGQAAPGTSTR